MPVFNRKNGAPLFCIGTFELSPKFQTQIIGPLTESFRLCPRKLKSSSTESPRA